VTWWPKNSQNPEIEYEHARFWGSEVAGAGGGRQNPETSTNARFGVVGTIGMARTPKLSTNMLNSGVARWRGRKRA